MAIKSYSLLLLTVLSPLIGSCSDEPDDPLDSADGFCAEWGKNACSKQVIAACQTTEAKCEVRQKDYCLDRVSESKYTRTNAEECLDFIKDAVRDKALELDELNAFVSLGAPCDMLLAGNGGVGDQCRKTEDCDTTEGLKCIIKFGETRGECHVPKPVNGGGRCTDPATVCVEGYYCDGRNCLASSQEGEECSAEVPCDESSRCIYEDADAEFGTCEPKLGLADRCESSDECASGICDRNEDEVEDGVLGFCVNYIELGRRVDMCKEF